MKCVADHGWLSLRTLFSKMMVFAVVQKCLEKEEQALRTVRALLPEHLDRTGNLLRDLQAQPGCQKDNRILSPRRKQPFVETADGGSSAYGCSLLSVWK